MMTSAEKIRVLVADDDYLASEKIREIVEMLGYSIVGEAADGYQAVEMTCALRPDIVLMDIQMSGMNGLLAAEKIQQRCPTPVVVLTAYQSPDLLEQANRAGVGAYLIKPPNPRELERTVTIALARFQDMQSLRVLNARLETEIAERRRTEQQLTRTLQEKDVLLKEVHHRVKNNLQMVSSLLYFQVESEDDQRVLDILQSSRDRIRSMAMVHEQIYQSETLAHILFERYIRSITMYLFHAYGVNIDRVQLQIDAEPVILTVETAIPCALVLNELVSNALKHAFPHNRAGLVHVAFSEREQEYCFVVRDTGIGLPEGCDIRRHDTLGLTLVTDLAEKQLHGTVTVIREAGTTVTVTFPKPL